MNQKKGARLALKLSLTVVIPIFLITIAGILLSAYKQSNLSEDLVKREISGIARSLRQTYLATAENCRNMFISAVNRSDLKCIRTVL